MTPDLRYIIWDLDGTLYSFREGFEQACVDASVRAAIKLGFKGTVEEAAALSERSYKEHRDNITLLHRKYAIPLKDMHREYHEEIDSSHMRPDHALAELFRRGAHRNALLTHASLGWAHRVLQQLGLRSAFEDRHILAMEDYDFIRKDHDEKPFVQMLQKLEAKPQECMMVEDSVGNLVIPHRLGMRTTWINAQEGTAPPYVDHRFSDAASLLQFLHRNEPSLSAFSR